jgi:hypothetical protein
MCTSWKTGDWHYYYFAMTHTAWTFHRRFLSIARGGWYSS